MFGLSLQEKLAKAQENVKKYTDRLTEIEAEASKDTVSMYLKEHPTFFKANDVAVALYDRYHRTVFVYQKANNKFIVLFEEIPNATPIRSYLNHEMVSMDATKHLLFYGKYGNKSIITEHTEQLDYAIKETFDILKESKRFDADKIETLFWKRIHALANFNLYNKKQGFNEILKSNYNI